MRQFNRRTAVPTALLALALFAPLAAGAGPAGVPSAPKPAQPAPVGGLDLDTVGRAAGRFAKAATSWYGTTHPTDRVTWGGLGAAAALGLGVVLDRMFRLRRRRVVPDEFNTRFLERMQDGRLDRGKALDYCELNASPASRVALAAVKRWGRPTADLERAVALAHRVESGRLRRNVGTLRRVAALSPLLGLLGSLFSLGRALNGLPAAAGADAWGPALAQALWPVTAGVALATVALVLYDGLAGKVESLSGTLDQVGAETIDAIVTTVPVESRLTVPLPSSTVHGPSSVGSARTPHQIRMEIPKPGVRVRIDDEDDYD